jgi:catechol-2,3-dioxygenase
VTPQLDGIDHIHVYVTNRDEAASWYGNVLGLKPVDEFMLWATPDGPLTLGNADHSVHLALFQRKEPAVGSAIAFRASGKNFMHWKTHLQDQAIELRIADHGIMYSLYFNDPDGNLHEITSADYDEIAMQLAKG